jgi:hypothetical protein
MLAKLPKVVAKNKYFVRALGLVVFSILAEAISAEEMLEREDMVEVATSQPCLSH